MKKKHSLIWALVFVFTYGCGGGIKFADEPMNRSLPEDYKNRKIYQQSDIFKYKLDSLVGRILVCKQKIGDKSKLDCDLKLAPIRKDNSTPLIKTPEQKVYSSKIDRGAAAEGSYLAFAAKLSADQAAEVLITDSVLVFIQDDDIPIEKLKAYVKANPKVGNENRYWIQGALLATIITRNLIKIDSNASGVVGTATGLKGQVYKNEGLEAIDYKISLLMPDIDRDIDENLATLEPGSKYNVGASIQSINGLDQLPLIDPKK